MLRRIIEILLLLAFLLIVLAVTSAFGPASRLPRIVEVNQAYIEVVRGEQLLLGLSGFGVVLIANAFARVGLRTGLIVAAVAGGLFFVAVHAEDMDNVHNLPKELLYFYADYLLAGACVVFTYLAASACFRKLRRG